MKIYISGPISGVANGNREAFEDAKRQLLEAGHEPVSPHDLHGELPKLWEEYMRVDIAALMGCDAILMLRGWVGSRGARIEMSLAYNLYMPTYHSVADAIRGQVP